jgi:hypothetical protein
VDQTEEFSENILSIDEAVIRDLVVFKMMTLGNLQSVSFPFFLKMDVG